MTQRILEPIVIPIMMEDLQGISLNWAVALCEGYEKQLFELLPMIVDNNEIRLTPERLFSPITDIEQGYGIMDREKISLLHDVEQGICWATKDDPRADETLGFFGQSALEAGMRCYVSHVMGSYVEIPEIIFKLSMKTAQASCKPSM